ncbi:MAG: RidA family protein [Pyrinomonadaceae bacterium]|nr:RidA family protein [Acidobacteriota bacterium]MBK7933275.1 RidA family protein [Acidobacteriota bacterium]MBP7374877.1 RidA family protein [Pyrinomonadaceae bacterium]
MKGFLLALVVLSFVLTANGQVKRAVESIDAPKAIGPYSQAVVANGFVFTAGQIGTDPKTGTLVEGGIAEQTEQVLKNLEAVLKASGSGFDQVVKTTVFLADMNDFAKMNEVYAKRFAKPFPARSTVQVARLPRDAKVEVEVVALVRTESGSDRSK